MRYHNIFQDTFWWHHSMLCLHYINVSFRSVTWPVCLWFHLLWSLSSSDISFDLCVLYYYFCSQQWPAEKSILQGECGSVWEHGTRGRDRLHPGHTPQGTNTVLPPLWSTCWWVETKHIFIWLWVGMGICINYHFMKHFTKPIDKWLNYR